MAGWVSLEKRRYPFWFGKEGLETVDFEKKKKIVKTLTFRAPKSS